MTRTLLKYIGGDIDDFRPVNTEIKEIIVKRSSLKKLHKSKVLTIYSNDGRSIPVGNFQGIIPVGSRVRIYSTFNVIGVVALDILDDKGNVTYEAVLDAGYDLK
jgi:hypothetical protein